ncbi:MAG: hypothetical protein J7M38_09560 [Armatimonadetes bacterium]|nr:hypothetical protein [Armatimonadota bacterium]
MNCIRVITASLLVSVLAGGGVQHACAQDLTMLEETLPPAYALTFDLTVNDPARFDLRVVFDYQDDGNYHALHLTSTQAVLERVSGGDSTPIGYSTAPQGLQAGTQLPVTIQRNDWRIVGIVGTQVVARGWDSELPGSKAGYLVAGGSVDAPFVQPLGEMYLSDDFVRAEEAQSSWEALRGVWDTQSLRVDPQSDRMEADKSMNAFSYLGKSSGDGPALTAAGYWFWSNYSVSAALRAQGSDAMGLAVYAQDADNYIAARWTSAVSLADDADRLTLLQVVDGKPTVLAQAPGGYLPDQWYQFELRVCDNVIQCAVDGETRLVGRSDAFGQGRPALYCEGTDGTLFDSVLVDRWEILTDDFETPAPGRWIAQSGKWSYKDGRLRGTGNGGRKCMAGGAGWQRYIFSADIYAGGSGGVGLVACGRDRADYVLRFGTGGVDYTGRAQLMLLRNGHSRELAGAPLKVKPRSWHRATVIVEDGLITAYLDGRRLFDAFEPQATQGRIGLYADGGASVLFDNAQLALLPERRSTRLTKEFTEGDEHPEMVEWASTRAPWIKPPDGAEPIWWTKGDYYGDKEIRFAIPKVGAATGSLRLSIDSSPDDASAGLTLIIDATEGSKTLKLRLMAGEEQVDAAEVETTADPCPVLVERRGTWFVVKVEDKLVFSIQR